MTGSLNFNFQKCTHLTFTNRFSADNLSQIGSETLLVMHVKTHTQPWHPTEIHLWNSPIVTVCEMSVGFICFVSRHLHKLEDLQGSLITHKSLTLHTYMLKWPSVIFWKSHRSISVTFSTIQSSSLVKKIEMCVKHFTKQEHIYDPNSSLYPTYLTCGLNKRWHRV